MEVSYESRPSRISLEGLAELALLLSTLSEADGKYVISFLCNVGYLSRQAVIITWVRRDIAAKRHCSVPFPPLVFVVVSHFGSQHVLLRRPHTSRYDPCKLHVDSSHPVAKVANRSERLDRKTAIKQLVS